jgi:hypothetical protein
MRFLAIAATLGVAAALPQAKGTGGSGAAPGGSFGNRGSNTENDLSNMNGQCKDIYFIMARASTEPGNMVCSDLSYPLICFH